jgi:myo-inositol 2-dehydrogenase/D-chiro-inositol 1-dehydrogenase
MDGPSKRVVNICVTGLGRIGFVHSGNVASNPRCRLQYVVDVLEHRAKEVAAKYPGCTPLTRLEDALKDPSLDAVIICSPTAVHVADIHACFAAGKVVMCEKPISLHPEEINSCYEEAKKKALPLLCGMFCSFQSSVRSPFQQATASCKAGSSGKSTPSEDHS